MVEFFSRSRLYWSWINGSRSCFHDGIWISNVRVFTNCRFPFRCFWRDLLIGWRIVFYSNITINAIRELHQSVVIFRLKFRFRKWNTELSRNVYVHRSSNSHNSQFIRIGNCWHVRLRNGNVNRATSICRFLQIHLSQKARSHISRDRWDRTGASVS